MCHLSDSRNLNLLLVAAESGRNDIVTILLNQNLDMEYKCSETGRIISAADLAWMKRHCNVVLTLLHANLRFPEGIIISECSNELKAFIETSEDLHSAITEKNESKIQDILNNNSNLNHFYNRLNISAPKLALDLRFIDIYELLLKNKIFLGYHETMSDLWTTFSDSEREILREIHFKYSINVPEKHLLSLSTNSSISHDDPQATQKLEYIRYAFGTLNNIPLVRIILMVVAASKIFNIIFDFNRQSVNVVDPTADSWTRGLFYIFGRIYIGAAGLLQRSTENEAFGTLAHELCHYAINLVYENRAKPYLSNDKEAKGEFSRICKNCKENSHKEEIIRQVFESYSKRMQHAELIVRVPHLMAMYHDNPEMLKELRENFGELFEYYEKRVVPDMEKALPTIEAENQIEKKARKILKYKIILVLGGIVSILVLIASVFIVRYIFYKPEYPFLGLSDAEQDSVRNAPIIYKDIEIKFKDLFHENSVAYEVLKSNHIKQMIMNMSLNFNDLNLQYLDGLVTHNWNNMTKKLKDKVLNRHFIFQNESVKFKDLNNNYPKLLNYLNSNQILLILNNQDFMVNKQTEKPTFYMNRKFFDADAFPIFFAYFLNETKNIDIDFMNTSIKIGSNFEEFYKHFKNQNSSIYNSEINKLKNNKNLKKFLLSETMKYQFLSYTTLQLDLEEIMPKNLKSKMFVLSSELGTGKTIIFKQLSFKIKKQFPMSWVSYIDLRNHDILLKKTSSNQKISKILVDLLNINQENEFEIKLFNNLFESGNVVLLWDSFENTSESISDVVFNILLRIKEMNKNFQYLSSCFKNTEYLGKKLGLLVYTIAPFDHDEQEEFLRKIMINKNVNLSKIHIFIQDLKNMIIDLKSNAKEKLQIQDFDSPLALIMLVEIVTCPKIEFDLRNQHKKYQKFVDKKIEIWQKSIPELRDLNDENQQINKLQILEIFKCYAILKISGMVEDGMYKLFFPKYINMNKKLPNGLIYEDISRMGILYLKSTYEFEFSHKIFIDFFAAQYFIDKIYDVQYTIEEEASFNLGIFYQTIMSDDEKFITMRNFINDYIETKKSNAPTSFNKIIARVITVHFSRIFFDLLVLIEIKTNDLTFLFNFFKKDYDILLIMLGIHENETLYTASYNIAYVREFDELKRFTSRLIKELGMIVLKADDYKKFIEGRNQKGLVMFSDFIYKKMLNYSIMPEKNFRADIEYFSMNDIFIFDQLKNKLTEADFKEIILFKNSPVYLNTDEKFILYIKTFLSESEYKIYLKNMFFKFAAHKYYDIRSLKDFPTLFFIKELESFLSDAEIQEFYTSRNILISNYLRANYEIHFNLFWKLFVNHSTTVQQKEILLKLESDLCEDLIFSLHLEKCAPVFLEFNLLQIIIFADQQSLSKEHEIFKLYETYFEKFEIQQIITNSKTCFPIMIEEDLEDILALFKYIFEGNDKKLKKYIEDRIKCTEFNLYKEENENIEEKLKPLFDFLKSL